MSVSVTGAPSDGNYTVSWSSGDTYQDFFTPNGPRLYDGYDIYELKERVDGGSWTTLEEWETSSVSFTGKAPGTYEYKLVWRVKNCISRRITTHDPYVHNGVAEQVSVTVPLPIPPEPGPISGDAASSTGSYTLNWRSSTGATSYELQEQLNGGSWSSAYTGTSTSHTLSGQTDGTYGYRVKACNASGCSDWTATKTVTVTLPPPDLMPSFDSVTVSAKTWTQNQAIAAFTVPAASGGDSALSYTASNLPSGVAMTAAREVSGTPTAAGSGTATVTVRDADGDTDTLDFNWTVNADLTPDFGSATVSAKTWTEDQRIAAFTVPEATGGDGTLTYTASNLPAGVAMTAAREVSGTPTAAGSGTATVTVRDADGDTDTLNFDWTVAADLVPDFGSATIADQSWTLVDRVGQDLDAESGDRRFHRAGSQRRGQRPELYRQQPALRGRDVRGARGLWHPHRGRFRYRHRDGERRRRRHRHLELQLDGGATNSSDARGNHWSLCQQYGQLYAELGQFQRRDQLRAAGTGG